MNRTLKVIGVPEHFNLPWHLALKDGAFADRGIDLIWEDIPEGTGRMAQMLASAEADLAVILTEGIIKSIAAGSSARMVQGYVQSPLLWGIHVAANSRYQEIDDLKNGKVAISRMGSGSHLMAFVNAQNQGWPPNQLQFEVVHTLENAVEVLQKGKADYFLWERFTSKPLVDQGVFRRLGDCPTPWPCFVLAASNKLLSENAAALWHVLEVINTYTSEFKDIPSIDRTIANRYGQQLEDVRQWLQLTEWGQTQLTLNQVEEVQEKLRNLGLLSTPIPAASYLVQQP